MKRDKISLRAGAGSLKKKLLKGSLFYRYFIVYSVIIFVSFLLIGVFLLFFTADYWRTTRLDTLERNAINLSNTASEAMSKSYRYGTAGQYDNAERAALVVANSIEQISKSIEADVFICNLEGKTILCKDMLSPDFLVSESGECPFHNNYKLSRETIESTRNGCISELTTLDNIYAEIHAVALAPLFVNDKFTGVAVITAPIVTELTEFSLRVIYFFLIAAGVALLISFVIVFAMSDRLTKPMREMAVATKHYANGDFSYRVKVRGDDELSRLIEDFNSMAEALAALESSRRSFVANVSHEFKTPMTTIGGFINGILDGTIPADRQEHYLNIVSGEVSRLTRLITTMLNISKIETGNVVLRCEPTDISEIIFNIFCGFEHMITSKNITVEGLDAISPIVIEVDEDMINQAIYNLIDNAVKFTNNGGVIKIGATQGSSSTTITIGNTGVGIPQRDIGRVFERFYKVDKSRSTDVKSVGLGLHLVKSIIELHGGTIRVDSTENEYTEFTAKLPNSFKALQ